MEEGELHQGERKKTYFVVRNIERLQFPDFYDAQGYEDELIIADIKGIERRERRERVREVLQRVAMDMEFREGGKRGERFRKG